MMLKRLLRRDARGIGAVEFALVAPVMISFVIGISQMGKLFFANADMKNAMAHGARAASVWPVPEPDVVEAAVEDRLERIGALAKANVEAERDTDPQGNDVIDITMTYQVPLEFIFFDIGPVTLTDTRRVYVQMPGVRDSGQAEEIPEDDEEEGTSTSTSTSSTGGDASTSTSASSTGGDASTSTSTGSTGGDSSTSTTSTSTSTTSSTTSSGNGNSNGNSNHGHGDCKKKC